MSENTADSSLAESVAAHLPYLRRYARALTGSQGSGDKYAIASLEAMISAPELVTNASSVKVGLFQAFHSIWASSGTPVGVEDGESDLREQRAQGRLKKLSANTREVLLLRTIEGFSFQEVGEIIGESAEEAQSLFDIAQSEMAEQMTGNVLIIEDEAIIAMDLHSIVSTMGHRVSGIARTRDGAIDLGMKDVPDLILADIQLADKSSGIDAVDALLGELGDRPVIFITAFPERLLSGEKKEPPFLITKPFTEEQVCAAVSQAMFFSTTEQIDLGA